MKKIQLHIASPCHEQWDHMTVADKGRFCASCQKTVIDFTQMSDRQVAEFFKKPQGNVCGRIYADQLERPLELPRKRIPWLRYFFQFTWPAFMMMLKSCGLKQQVVGEMVVRKEAPVSTKYAVQTMGMILQPIDTANAESKNQQEFIPPVVIGEMQADNDTAENSIDSIAVAVPDKIPDTTIHRTVIDNPIDTGKCSGDVIMVGGISSGRYIPAAAIDTIRKNKEMPETLNEKGLKVFPNPVRAGSVVRIATPENSGIPKQIQLFASNGQLITRIEQGVKDYATLINLSIPPATRAGVYVVRIVYDDRKVESVKIVVE